MSDYIKRVDAMRSIIAHDQLKDLGDSIGYAEWLLNKAPSADAAPVRHGRWEKNDDYTCSLCGYRMVIGDGAYNYCPNCGARMDKDGDD